VSRYDYECSKRIAAECPPFAALIMAAMRGADTRNAEELRRSFPEIGAELTARYNAPGGVLDSEVGAS
jgi:hypothetical protein